MARPTHLPIRLVAPVIKAARKLSAAQKLVLLETLELDQGGEDGAWLGAGNMAERLGFAARESVEQHRRELRELGLLKSRQVPGRRTASWYVALPSESIPASGLGRRPGVDAIMCCARALDQYILARSNGAAQYANPVSGGDAEMAQRSTPVRAHQPAHLATPLTTGADREMAYPNTPRLAYWDTPRSREEELPPSPASRSVWNTSSPPASEVDRAGEGGAEHSHANGEAGEAGGVRFPGDALRDGGGALVPIAIPITRQVGRLERALEEAVANAQTDEARSRAADTLADFRQATAQSGPLTGLKHGQEVTA